MSVNVQQNRSILTLRNWKLGISGCKPPAEVCTMNQAQHELMYAANYVIETNKEFKQIKQEMDEPIISPFSPSSRIPFFSDYVNLMPT